MAIDPATRRVFIAIQYNKTAAAKPFFGAVAKGVKGMHKFGALRQALGVEHRPTKPKSPQTNGMVERFNGRGASGCRQSAVGKWPAITYGKTYP